MKNKLKFNILDAFIIVFVLCAAFVVCVKMTGTDVVSNNGQFSKAEVVIKLSSMRDFTAEAVPEAGTEIFVNDTDARFGLIIKKEITPAKTNQLLTDGKTVETEVANRYDVYVTVEVEGIQQQDGYYVNGNQCLSIGASNAYRGNGNIFYGEIYSIKD
ncbi:MAG: DUF4330 domain-containing protein [Clostridia bacterium]|nr:DUF4330 domain-containing protein [Clostridia bacterium]